MRNKIGKERKTSGNDVEIADFRALGAAENSSQKQSKNELFEIASGGGGIARAVCASISPKVSELERRYRAFHAFLNTTNRQRSI